MKELKLLPILIFLLIIISFFATSAAAQREISDYDYQYEKYGEAYDQFELSRDKFLKYQVLSSREEARADTRALILQRNQVLRTWFLALKSKVRNTPGVIEADNGLLGLLDQKIVWLEEQSDETSNLETPSFEDLFILSDRIEDKEVELMKLGYQSLAEVILGKIRTLKSESVALTTLLNEEISKTENATKSAQLTLWIKEVEVKNYLAGKEIEAAEINLWNLRSAGGLDDMKKHFTNLKIDVDDTKLYLEQALSYQKEILGEIASD
jgi:hypothetical protein